MTRLYQIYVIMRCVIKGLHCILGLFVSVEGGFILRATGSYSARLVRVSM